MADQISEPPQPTSENPELQNFSNKSSDFDPNTMRNTKPGLKRLFLTITILFSFVLASPILIKSIEIYRSTLPFRDIDSLSNLIESNPLHFPCHFQAVFLGFKHKTSTGFSADKLGLAISDQMRALSNINQACGSCSDNYTVSVAIDDGKECADNRIGGNGCSWGCGSVSVDDFDENLEGVDGMLKKVLGNCGTVYSVVVVNRDDEEVRAVVGKYRHAWMVGRVSEAGVVPRVAETLVKVFMNGGKEEGLIHGEFMPVGADGRIVLSFNLLNADPRDRIYDWDFRRVDEIFLAPIIEALAPIANISVESQVQSLPRMIIMDEIGKQVKFSLEAAKLAQSNASGGIYYASAMSSREARSLAEDAFFHPSIMSVSYYSFEHCFAVYSPFFLPVLMHALLAALREWRRYKHDKTKYLLWKAKVEVASQ